MTVLKVELHSSFLEGGVRGEVKAWCPCVEYLRSYIELYREFKKLHRSYKQMTICFLHSLSKMSPSMYFLKWFSFFLKDFFLNVDHLYWFVTILLLFYVLVFWRWGMWDLSSLTRDQTHTPCLGRRSLNLPRKSPEVNSVPNPALLRLRLGPDMRWRVRN